MFKSFFSFLRLHFVFAWAFGTYSLATQAQNLAKPRSWAVSTGASYNQYYWPELYEWEIKRGKNNYGINTAVYFKPKKLTYSLNIGVQHQQVNYSFVAEKTKYRYKNRECNNLFAFVEPTVLVPVFTKGKHQISLNQGLHINKII
jgi:hypothetical protein